MRSMLIRTLRLSGLSLTNMYQAGDGAEALSTLAEHDVDLVLIDINMPVMNGAKLIDQVRADGRLAGVALIVVSTEGSEARIGALKARGVSFIHKPFTPSRSSSSCRSPTNSPKRRCAPPCARATRPRRLRRRRHVPTMASCA